MTSERDLDIATRVLNAVGAASYEMTALLSLLRLELSDAVPTASISCERRPVLRINPVFVKQHCRTDEHLFLLVMHELHHVLLGHTRLFPRATTAHNVAFDAVINSMLVRRFPAQAYTSFFLDIYAGQQGPLRLLAPPAADPIDDAGLRQLHTLLYQDDCVTSEEVFGLVTERLCEGCRNIDGAVLLGSHDAGQPDSWGTGGPIDAEFVDAIRSIVEKWPPPEDHVRGRSLADLLSRTTTTPFRPAQQVLAAVRHALLAAATRRLPGPSPERTAEPVQAAMPTASDRRAAVSRQAGIHPLLYTRSMEGRRRGRAGRARAYLDVSGSMVAYIPLLYGALSSLRAHIEPRLCLFSTAIQTIPIDDLVRGQVVTTGGTDITCVVRDLLDHHVKKALVITDGYVGQICASDRKSLAFTALRVLLTPDGWRRDLEGVATTFTELPVLEKPGDVHVWTASLR
jgi:hypothetical protein